MRLCCVLLYREGYYEGFLKGSEARCSGLGFQICDVPSDKRPNVTTLRAISNFPRMPMVFSGYAFWASVASGVRVQLALLGGVVRPCKPHEVGLFFSCFVSVCKVS